MQSLHKVVKFHDQSFISNYNLPDKGISFSTTGEVATKS